MGHCGFSLSHSFVRAMCGEGREKSRLFKVSGSSICLESAGPPQQ
jgi:hypothetical protein